MMNKIASSLELDLYSPDRYQSSDCNYDELNEFSSKYCSAEREIISFVRLLPRLDGNKDRFGDDMIALIDHSTPQEPVVWVKFNPLWLEDILSDDTLSPEEKLEEIMDFFPTNEVDNDDFTLAISFGMWEHARHVYALSVFPPKPKRKCVAWVG